MLRGYVLITTMTLEVKNNGPCNNVRTVQSKAILKQEGIACSSVETV